jgi:hypothetical protein
VTDASNGPLLLEELTASYAEPQKQQSFQAVSERGVVEIIAAGVRKSLRPLLPRGALQIFIKTLLLSSRRI